MGENGLINLAPTHNHFMFTVLGKQNDKHILSKVCIHILPPNMLIEHSYRCSFFLECRQKSPLNLPLFSNTIAVHTYFITRSCFQLKILQNGKQTSKQTLLVANLIYFVIFIIYL